MANFEAPLLQAACSSAYKTAGALWVASTVRRVMLYEAEFGQTGTLAASDTQVEWDLSRFSATAILTASAVTLNLNDEGDAAVAAAFANNATTELTYTTAGFGLQLKHWAVNQRGSYRWRALDDGDQLMLAATSLKGFGLRAQSVSFVGSLTGNISGVER